MKLKYFFLPLLLFFGTILALSFTILLLFNDEETESSNHPMNQDNVTLSQDVEAHRELVEQYAREFGIEEHVPLLLAIIQVESEGNLEDVMQSSESLNLPPNTLSTEESIEQGTRYFSELITSVEELGLDLETALQAYNFGGGFISFVSKRTNSYSSELAEGFARDQANGHRVNYSNPIAIERNGGWRYSYGNMFYVDLVNQYLSSPPSSDSSGTDWIRPAEGVVTSPFGYRIHPIYGDRRLHTGIDIAGSGAILAARSGTVISASYNNGLGYFVRIDHGDGYESVYGHMTPNLLVSIGDSVSQGQRIGTMGTTGTSTGVHLDFQIIQNGTPIDPAPYIGL